MQKQNAVLCCFKKRPQTADKEKFEQKSKKKKLQKSGSRELFVYNEIIGFIDILNIILLVKTRKLK